MGHSWDSTVQEIQDAMDKKAIQRGKRWANRKTHFLWMNRKLGKHEMLRDEFGKVDEAEIAITMIVKQTMRIGIPAQTDERSEEVIQKTIRTAPMWYIRASQWMGGTATEGIRQDEWN